MFELLAVGLLHAVLDVSFALGVFSDGMLQEQSVYSIQYSNYLGLLGHWYRKTRPRCYLNHAGGMSPKASLQCSSCLKRGSCSSFPENIFSSFD